MANYFSGEEIKVGDFITTDNGHDKNKVIKLIDNTYLMQSYGLDCFGALLSSSRTFISRYKIHKKKNNLNKIIETELTILIDFAFY